MKREISKFSEIDKSYKDQSTGRKCGKLTGRFYCAGAEREFQNGESREDKSKEEEGEELS